MDASSGLRYNINKIRFELQYIVANIYESTWICPHYYCAIKRPISGNLTLNALQIRQHGGYLILFIAQIAIQINIIGSQFR